MLDTEACYVHATDSSATRCWVNSLCLCLKIFLSACENMAERDGRKHTACDNI